MVTNNNIRTQLPSCQESQKANRTLRDRLLQFIKAKVLHVNDSPHRIALGAALGLFVAWTPAMGLHMLMVLGMSVLLRANKFTALTCVWVSNPFTLVAIYYPNYLLGKTLLRFFGSDSLLANDHAQPIYSHFGSSAFFSGFFRPEFWWNLWNFIWYEGAVLWLGSLIMGLVIALLTYLATYHLVTWHRKNHPHPIS